MDKELKIGSIVMLKSSDSHEQKFTYGGLSGSGNGIVYWYTAGELKTATVAPECLKVVG